MHMKSQKWHNDVRKKGDDKEIRISLFSPYKNHGNISTDSPYPKVQSHHDKLTLHLNSQKK